MKKFISFVLCLIMLMGALVLPEPIEAHAEEDNKSKEYYVEFLASSVNSFGSDDFKGEYSNFKVKYDTDIVMYLVHGSGWLELRMLVVLPDGSLDDLIGSGYNLRYYANDVTLGLYIDGCYKFHGGRDYDFYQKTEEKEGAGGTFKCITSTIEESGFISTNIPIFENKDAAIGFLGGSVSIKNAINYASDISDIKYDLEVPQNMKLSKKESIFDLPTYTMVWEQTDEDYKNWTTEVYIYISLDAWEGALGIHLWGDSYTFEDIFLMADSFSTYKLKYVIDVDSDKYQKADRAVCEYIFNTNPKVTGMATDYYKVYMRNAYYDGTYRHYSNWLLVEFDYEFESGQGTTSIIEMGGSVNDTPGMSKPSQDIVGDVVTDSQYDGTIDGNLVQTDTDILGWIQSGFGIGGDNGVLAMIGETFDFIPSEVWAVMMAGISLMVAVAVFKFIRG